MVTADTRLRTAKAVNAAGSIHIALQFLRCNRMLIGSGLERVRLYDVGLDPVNAFICLCGINYQIADHRCDIQGCYPEGGGFEIFTAFSTRSSQASKGFPLTLTEQLPHCPCSQDEFQLKVGSCSSFILRSTSTNRRILPASTW